MIKKESNKKFLEKAIKRMRRGIDRENRAFVRTAAPFMRLHEDGHWVDHEDDGEVRMHKMADLFKVALDAYVSNGFFFIVSDEYRYTDRGSKAYPFDLVVRGMLDYYKALETHTKRS